MLYDHQFNYYATVHNSIPMAYYYGFLRKENLKKESLDKYIRNESSSQFFTHIFTHKLILIYPYNTNSLWIMETNIFKKNEWERHFGLLIRLFFEKIIYPMRITIWFLTDFSFLIELSLAIALKWHAYRLNKWASKGTFKNEKSIN